MNDELVERFWRRVQTGDHGECWPWTGDATTNPAGQRYGSFYNKGRRLRAHRVSWELHNNRPVPTGLLVRHKCDNSICCNPAHLEIGTHKDNAHDRYERGRDNHARGTRHGIAKLNEAAVREIKALLKTGLSQRKIAARFGVTQCPISEIKSGKGWRHVE